MNNHRKAYRRDLNDGEWAQLETLIPAVQAGGRPAKYERRVIVNAVLYVLRTGSSWRRQPPACPPWH